MLGVIGKKIFGSRNERLVKNLQKQVNIINKLEDKFVALSSQELALKTPEFKERYAKGETLDQLLPEAFAVVREVSKRTIGLRHFDVQLIGGMVLHSGKISEMKTGEGKTLVATLALYLNALTGRGVHLITVNDYLAERDANWMRPIYEFLGLSLGIIKHGLSREEKINAYASDVVYGTNNEFGFDYLRDNMAFSKDERTQRDLYFAVVDEVDSILIDEARTPLIISGADQESSSLYVSINKIVPSLTKQEEKDGPGDFSIDEKTKQAYLTEEGHEHVEQLLVDANLINENESLYDAKNLNLMHHIIAAIRANFVFHNNVEYIVKDGQIVIVDEHTGRTMPGRRWSDGLHQAIEAKEGVKIQSENQTLASITFQNFFRLYTKLSGMTGTADTEAYELQQIYGLEVVVIPTNKPCIRKDNPDLIFLTEKEKFDAILEDIQECVKKGQPVLVGTVSIEVSEYLSKFLRSKKVAHNVLNAKFHEQEASIVAQAGKPGAVTIATNMAGRGTDIVLGGNLEVELEDLKQKNDGIELDSTYVNEVTNKWRERHQRVLDAGGLHIIGTERHESRRIDNQLRGRSGRQGDPGSSRFYLATEDTLMRIFVSDNVRGLLAKLGLKEGESITHPWVNRSIENAQRKVEGFNFDIRKQLLEFDDVANDQRKVVYQQRNEIMDSDDVSETISLIMDDVVKNLVSTYIPPQSLEEQWDIEGLDKSLEKDFGIKLELAQMLETDEELNEEKIINLVEKEFTNNLAKKEEQSGEQAMRRLEKAVLLNVLDTSWKEHLATMDYLRQSVHLRGYAQKDPKQEYKREAFSLFTNMLENIKHEVISVLMVVQIQAESDVAAMNDNMRAPQNLEYVHPELKPIGQGDAAVDEQHGEVERGDNKVTHISEAKTGRNEKCPCGSGQKFKYCHGKL